MEYSLVLLIHRKALSRPDDDDIVCNPCLLWMDDIAFERRLPRNAITPALRADEDVARANSIMNNALMAATTRNDFVYDDGRRDI